MDDSQDKLYLQVLNGQKGDRVPFWFMRQAGRYLPEYRELRADKGGFLEMVYDSDAACEITMQPIRRFGMDAAILFSDILVVPQALGQDLWFVQGEGPKLNPIQNLEELKALQVEGIDDVLNPVYDTVSKTRKALKDEGYDHVALIGFAGSPWTVATYMVEGAGSKDYLGVKTIAYQNPEFFEALIDILIDATSAYLIRQVDAGAEALQLFDSWSGVLDEIQFKRWVIEPTRRIVEKIRAVHPDVPIIGFPKGAGLFLPNYISQTGVNVAGLDSQMPLRWAAETIQPHLPVQGNLDPACLLAGGDVLEQEVDRILENFSDRPFIFNLGHGINKETPIAHVESVVKRLKNFSC